MRLLFKRQLKNTPELKQVIQLYEQGAIKTATKAMEILQKHNGLSKDPTKQSDYLSKALKQPKERRQRAVEQPIRQGAAAKIQKFLRNNVTFKIVEKERALKDNVVSVSLRPAIVGGRFTGDLRSLFAKANLQAKRQLLKGTAKYRVRASAHYNAENNDGEIRRSAINANVYDSGDLPKFLVPQEDG